MQTAIICYSRVEKDARKLDNVWKLVWKTAIKTRTQAVNIPKDMRNTVDRNRKSCPERKYNLCSLGLATIEAADCVTSAQLEQRLAEGAVKTVAVAETPEALQSELFSYSELQLKLVGFAWIYLCSFCNVGLSGLNVLM